MALRQRRVTDTLWHNFNGPPARRAINGRGQGSKALELTGKDQQQIEVLISLALRWGVLLSCAIIGVGAAMILVSLGAGPDRSGLSSALSHGSGRVVAFRSPNEVLRGLSRWDPNAVIAVGLLILMTTPVVPLVLSAASFLRERDRAFTLITLLVLAILAAGLFLTTAGPLAASSQ